jgi:D-alanine-D-alanine ligase
MTERKLRVAVVFGGRSTEHAVSCLSAGSVLSHLDRDRFDVLPVGITPDGAWVLVPDDPAALTATDDRLPSLDTGTALALPTSRELVVMEPERVGEVLGGIDVVFPVLHGAYGEDGTIQGLLEMAGIPYAGAGVLASAAAMDKEYGKKLFAAEGLPIAPYAVLRRGVATLDAETRERLGLPLFVKPARAGSSTGITKVTDWAGLDAAIATARLIDPKVIVESEMVGREVECGVLVYPDGRVDASLPA